MRRIQTLGAMVLLVSLLMIFFYSTLHLDRGHSHWLGPEVEHSGHPNLQEERKDSKDVKVRSTTKMQEITFTTPHLNVHDDSVSDDFRKSVPQNGAYWNRLLHSALENLDKGGNPQTVKGDFDRSSCRETNQELLQTNVHDFSSYPVLFQDFLRGMNCQSAPILIDQPNKCISDGSEGRDNQEQGQHRTFLLFAIKSSARNFEHRQAVRETWGREGVHGGSLRVRTVFLLGSRSTSVDPDLGPLLGFEAGLYRDILQWDFTESLLNLTLKMNLLFGWASLHCPGVSFVFSGDDDVFVNTPALLGYLHSLEPSKASRLYVGHVLSAASPLRDSKSKYYIPLSFYNGPYPAYAGGGGFLFSGVLLKPLHSVSRIIPFFPIDDVYTGMCFQMLGVSPKTHNGFHTFDVQEQDRENLCVHKSLILIHQRSPQQMEKLWNGIHSPLLTC